MWLELELKAEVQSVALITHGSSRSGLGMQEREVTVA